ncbi:MAG: hypothetical protein WEB33_08875, partial [Bacteroidota bacterium]
SQRTGSTIALSSESWQNGPAKKAAGLIPKNGINYCTIIGELAERSRQKGGGIDPKERDQLLHYHRRAGRTAIAPVLPRSAF